MRLSPLHLLPSLIHSVLSAKNEDPIYFHHRTLDELGLQVQWSPIRSFFDGEWHELHADQQQPQLKSANPIHLGSSQGQIAGADKTKTELNQLDNDIHNDIRKIHTSLCAPTNGLHRELQQHAQSDSYNPNHILWDHGCVAECRSSFLSFENANLELYIHQCGGTLMFEQRFLKTLVKTNYRNLTSETEVNDFAPLVQTEFPRFVQQQSEKGMQGIEQQKTEEGWQWFVHKGCHVAEGKARKGVMPDSFVEGYEANGPLIWFKDGAGADEKHQTGMKKAIVLFHGGHFKHGVLSLKEPATTKTNMDEDKVSKKPAFFNLGLAAELTKIPKNTRYQAILLPVPNAGVSEALKSWGEQLRHIAPSIGETGMSIDENLRLRKEVYQKEDVTVNKVGFFTDNGAQYYGDQWNPNRFLNSPTHRQTLDLYQGWLIAMDYAVRDSGLTFQTCMVLPSDVITAALYAPSVTNARASDDYAALKNWDIGATAALMDAAGSLKPSKDNFWTKSKWPEGMPKYPAQFGDASKNLDLHSLVAVLSTGPVGPSDMDLNHTILERTARTDGLILGPEKPLTLLNMGFKENLYKTSGRVSSTEGVNGFRGFLAGNITTEIEVRKSDFPVNTFDSPSSVVFSRDFFGAGLDCEVPEKRKNKGNPHYEPELPKKGGKEKGSKKKKKHGLVKVSTYKAEVMTVDGVIWNNMTLDKTVGKTEKKKKPSPKFPVFSLGSCGVVKHKPGDNVLFQFGPSSNNKTINNKTSAAKSKSSKAVTKKSTSDNLPDVTVPFEYHQIFTQIDKNVAVLGELNRYVSLSGKRFVGDVPVVVIGEKSFDTVVQVVKDDPVLIAWYEDNNGIEEKTMGKTGKTNGNESKKSKRIDDELRTDAVDSERSEGPVYGTWIHCMVCRDNGKPENVGVRIVHKGSIKAKNGKLTDIGEGFPLPGEGIMVENESEGKDKEEEIYE